MKYVLNFGGGVNSTAMYFVLKERKLPIDAIIFADTGAELPETYSTVKKFEEIAKADGVPFITVKSKLGNIYDFFYSRKHIPSRFRRDCTFKFKIAPIRNHMKVLYPKANPKSHHEVREQLTFYIGIASEEFHRMRTSPVKYITNSYPLVDFNIDRKECIAILTRHGITDVIKSGCYICPFASQYGWKLLYDRHPELFEKALALEMNTAHAGKSQLNHLPLTELKRRIIANSIKPRGQAVKPENEITCDVAGSCFL